MSNDILVKFKNRSDMILFTMKAWDTLVADNDVKYIIDAETKAIVYYN